MDGFASAHAKISRASERLRSIEDQAATWAAGSSPYLINRMEPSPTGTGTDLVVRVGGLQPIAVDLRLAVDEALHHLRSSLDHAVWQLVLDNGQAPKRQYFPVLKVPKASELSAAIAGTNARVRAVVEQYQPYQQVTPKTHINSATWVLHHLDIVSKHRSVVSVWPFSTKIAISTPEGVAGKQVKIGAASTDDDPALPSFARVSDVDPAMDDPGNWIGVSVPILWIEATHDLPMGPLLDTLGRIERWTMGIVDALEAVR